MRPCLTAAVTPENKTHSKSRLGPPLGKGNDNCDETNTQLWDMSLMCLLFCISREMGGNTSFTLSKVSGFEGNGRSMVQSTALNVGVLLLLCPRGEAE